MNYYTDFKFQQPDLISSQLKKGTYDGCSFEEIDFSNQFLDGYTFLDCIFRGCNLSNSNVGGSQFSDSRFLDCKLLGLKMENKGMLNSGLTFINCHMDFASARSSILRGTSFEGCSLRDADFSDCDLSGASFITCDLNRALFFHSNLEGVNFTTSLNISLDPDQNRLKKARFSLQSLPGLLQKYGIEIDH